MSSNNSSPIIKNIEVGKFYFVHDKSSIGHPGFVVWKNDEKNRYLVVRFDSDKKGEIPKKDKGARHITKLKHPTDINVVSSYVRNRPFLCKRKDIGYPMPDLNVHPDDLETVNKVSKNKPELSRSLK